jgi:hypothetical protein
VFGGWPLLAVVFEHDRARYSDRNDCSGSIPFESMAHGNPTTATAGVTADTKQTTQVVAHLCLLSNERTGDAEAMVCRYHGGF